MFVNNNRTTRILIVIIARLSILTFFSGRIYVFSIENKVKQQLNQQQENQNVIITEKKRNDKKQKLEIQSNKNLNRNQKLSNVTQIT